MAAACRASIGTQVDAGCPLPATLAEWRLPEGFAGLEQGMSRSWSPAWRKSRETDVALADLVLMMIGGLALARALGPGELPTGSRAAKQAVN